MNRLFLLRGIPGCGKTAFIDNLKLNDYTISSGDIRKEIKESYRVNKENHDYKPLNYSVFEVIYQKLEERMKTGEDTIVDSTNIDIFDNYMKLADTYNYKIIIVNFFIPLRKAIDQSREKLKENIRSVPPSIIHKMYERIYKTVFPESFEIIIADDFEKYWNDERICEYLIENKCLLNGKACKKKSNLKCITYKELKVKKTGKDIYTIRKDVTCKRCGSHFAYIYEGVLYENGVPKSIIDKNPEWYGKYYNTTYLLNDMNLGVTVPLTCAACEIKGLIGKSLDGYNDMFEEYKKEKK